MRVFNGVDDLRGVKVRAPVQTDFQASLATAGSAAAGQGLRLSLINSHSRFYRNQELIT